jgi:hypothetical protein
MAVCSSTGALRLRQRPPAWGCGSRHPAHRQQGEIHDHGIKAGVRNGKGFGMTLLEGHRWMALTSLCSLGRGKVDANHGAPTLRCCRGGVACSCRDIEGPRSSPTWAASRRGSITCVVRCAKMLMVLRCDILPPRISKIPESHRIQGLRPCHHPFSP